MSEPQNNQIEILIENLYDALDEFEVAYNEADFSGPLSAVLGEDLYERLADDAAFYLEGVGLVGEVLARGHLIPSRVYLSPCPNFLDDICAATEILKGVY